MEIIIITVTNWSATLAGRLLLQVSAAFGARRHCLAGLGTLSARRGYASGVSVLLTKANYDVL